MGKKHIINKYIDIIHIVTKRLKGIGQHFSVVPMRALLLHH